MANIATQRIKREFKEVIKSEEVTIVIIINNNTHNTFITISYTKTLCCVYFWVNDFAQFLNDHLLVSSSFLLSIIKFEPNSSLNSQAHYNDS